MAAAWGDGKVAAAASAECGQGSALSYQADHNINPNVTQERN